MGGIVGDLMLGAGGAAGALALDVILGYVPLPDSLKTGLPRHGIRAAGAIGLGYVASRLLGRQKGMVVGMGALTVVMYGFLKDMVKQYSPIALPGLDGWDDGYNDVQLGYVDAAPQLEAGAGAYMEDGGIDVGAGAYMDL